VNVVKLTLKKTKQHFCFHQALLKKYTMKRIILSLCIFFPILLHAQESPSLQKKSHKITIEKGWFLSLNPLSAFEQVHAAIGVGVGYAFSNRWQVWTEINYLGGALTNTSGASKDLKGIRNIIALKHFTGQKGFFIGIEGRCKYFSFTDRDYFINGATGDTLSNVANTAEHTVMGAAVFWGKRIPLSPGGKWQLELSLGLGMKKHDVSRKNIPDTYKWYDFSQRGRLISLDKDTFAPYGAPYAPCAIRIICQL
jgi:Protein of unknown function (DUF3575)